MPALNLLKYSTSTKKPNIHVVLACQGTNSREPLPSPSPSPPPSTSPRSSRGIDGMVVAGKDNHTTDTDGGVSRTSPMIDAIVTVTKNIITTTKKEKKKKRKKRKGKSEEKGIDGWVSRAPTPP